MVEGVAPVTRFRRVDEAEGCATSTRASRPIEKPCQLTIAVPEDCWIAIAFGRGVEMPTVPYATEPPVGNSPASAGARPPRAVEARRAAVSCVVEVRRWPVRYIGDNPCNLLLLTGHAPALETDRPDEGEAVLVGLVVVPE